MTNPDQIWPIAVLNCGQNVEAAGPSRRSSIGGLTPEQEREKINREMAKIFEKSLKAHLTGKCTKCCLSKEHSIVRNAKLKCGEAYDSKIIVNTRIFLL